MGHAPHAHDGEQLHAHALRVGQVQEAHVQGVQAQDVFVLVSVDMGCLAG